MNLGELFIELGVVGDVKPLKEALKTLKQAQAVANRDIKLNKLKLKLIKDVTNATTKEEKSLLSATYVQERRNILQNEDIQTTQDAIKGKESLAKSIGENVKKFTAFVGAGIAAVAVIDKMVNNLIRANQTWVNFTRQTDLSLKSLQKYSGVASLLDKSLGMEGAAGSIEQLNKRLFELRLTGEGARGFQLAGVNPIGQDAFGVIEQLRSRFQGMDNTTATYLMEQMGLDPKLLPLIRMTRKEFEDLNKSIEKYQLTAKQREEIQKMNIQLEIASTKIRYLKDRAILAIMPAFIKFMASLARVTEGLKVAVKYVSDFISKSPQLQSALMGVAMAFGIIFAAAHPLMTLFTALFLIIDDIVGYFQGKNSGIGYIINFFDDYIAELKEKFGDLSFNKIIPEITIDVGKVIIKAGQISFDKAQEVIGEQFAKGRPLPPVITSISALYVLLKANYEKIKEISEQYGVKTGGAASLGYAGTLPDLSSAFITPGMQRNISNNSVTNNYDNRQINQSNSIMTNQTVDSLQHELVFARNSMNAGFA